MYVCACVRVLSKPLIIAIRQQHFLIFSARAYLVFFVVATVIVVNLQVDWKFACIQISADKERESGFFLGSIWW